MKGLHEALQYQEGKIDARRMKISVKPVESFTSEDIKQIRTKTGLSQNAFASSLGVSKKTVEAWECGKNTPNGPSCRLLQLFRDNPEIIEQHVIKAETPK